MLFTIETSLSASRNPERRAPCTPGTWAVASPANKSTGGRASEEGTGVANSERMSSSVDEEETKPWNFLQSHQRDLRKER